MANHLSEDLRWRDVYLWLDSYKSKEISQLLYIGEATVKRILHYYQLWSCVKDPFRRKKRRKRMVDNNDMNISHNIHISTKIFINPATSDTGNNMTNMRTSLSSKFFQEILFIKRNAKFMDIFTQLANKK
ncbi:homeodomain-like protein [Rhizophagus clarus]|uniref:Homeodomain-like protein n=1 Tax=Rhizophagus clarus TaxID=94130 RepID=A0A8H3QC51_9GLOM|nr:homeodomain-like protein [Rhizophagus clarus]